MRFLGFCLRFCPCGENTYRLGLFCVSVHVTSQELVIRYMEFDVIKVLSVHTMKTYKRE